jgi:hypothetical protein
MVQDQNILLSYLGNRELLNHWSRQHGFLASRSIRDRTFGLPELLSFQEVLLNSWTGHKPQIRVLLQMWLWDAHVLILGCKQLSYILIPGVLLELNHILSLEGHLSVATHPKLIQLLWVSYHIKLHVQCFEH